LYAKREIKEREVIPDPEAVQKEGVSVAGATSTATILKPLTPAE
jgi:hypothetical protein